MLLLEFLVAALVVPLALFLPKLGDSVFRPIEKRLSRFATHRFLAVIAVLSIALGTRLLVLPIEPIPRPWFYDEFSYLLMSDTFSHGRLTNATHPMWKHFETFYVNHLPAYCSMYYPAQGLFLALGQKFLLHPFWGVWLSTGLMCAAFCWALQAWMPPAWALLGGVLAIIRLGTFSYWADSYWGGSVAALGGALVLGALPRIQRYRRLRDASIMGIGLAILGNSRPYESVFYTFPILFALVWSLLKSDRSSRTESWRRVIVPIAAIVLVTLGVMSLYFKRCTGSALRPPYLVYVHTYQTAPEFPWQPLNTNIHYRHSSIAEFELTWPVQEYENARHHILGQFLFRVVKGGMFFSGPLLTLPWFVLAVILPYGLSMRDLGHKTGLLMGICLVSILGLSLPVYFEDHYAAPVSCAFYALGIQATRRMYVFDRHGKQTGRLLVRYMIAGVVLLFGIRTFSSVLHIAPTHWHRDWQSGGGQGAGREFVESKLQQDTGRHLVIVRYGTNHDPFNEWVYNNADIDDSKIVWARDMGPQQNAELIHYFSSRKIWIFEPDEAPPNLSSYAVPPDPPTAH